jgi:ubiquinone/menaquinone biosynthesis C-methylase UbiE
VVRRSASRNRWFRDKLQVSAEVIRREMVGYYHTRESVQEYIEMAEGYDGRALVQVLKRHLRPGATVLELGMGPGKDLDILSESFQVTGSDYSRLFLERYREKNPQVDLVHLDAVTMDIDRTFDCIYSNKVLCHLTQKELEASLHRQAEVLNSNGLLLHALWYGDKEESFAGLRFVYYTERSFAKLVGAEYEVLEAEQYSEMEEKDSIYFVLRKKQ